MTEAQLQNGSSTNTADEPKPVSEERDRAERSAAKEARSKKDSPSKNVEEPPKKVATPATPAAQRRKFRPSRSSQFFKVFVFLLIAGGIAGGVALKLRPPKVTTSVVTRGMAVEAVYATGIVEAYDRVVVKSKVSGTLAKLTVREGQSVKKGDLIGIVDAPALKFDLAKGKAELWAATQLAAKNSPSLEVLEAQSKVTETELKTARDDVERINKLVNSGSATQVELDKVRSRVTALESQLVAQQAQRKALRIDLNAKASGTSAVVDSLSARLSDVEVRAPIDGVVLSKHIEVGEVIALNQPIVRIGDVSNLVIECAIDEADIGKLTLGKKTAVSLYAFQPRVFDGEVFEIQPDADRAKKSFLTKVRLKKPPVGLRSGMSAEVNVVVEERAQAILAPAEGIDANGNAWVLVGDRVEQRSVKVGTRDMLRVEVLSGLSEGDTVVLSGFETLKPGLKVVASAKPITSAIASSPTKQGAGL